MKNASYLLIAFVLVIGIHVQAVAQSSPRMHEQEFLKYAIHAANWIESHQLESDDRTTWPVTPAESESVSYNLYNGISGIVLFHLQLYHATDEAKYLESAKRGANALLAHAEKLNEKSDPGYWTGYTGIGATLAEVYRATGDQKYLDGYKRCFKLLLKIAKETDNSKRGGVHFNAVTDIIGGSAGIGYFLLYADEVLKEDQAFDLAVRVGDGLLDAGQPVLLENNTTAVKWMMAPNFPREMPNYSHGTAGICDFLLSLDVRLASKTADDSATDYDSRFKNAAVSGARYLVSIADVEKGKCLIIHHRNTAADETEEVPLYYLGWCHGPSGTGRLFINLSKSKQDRAEWMDYAIRGGSALLESGIPAKRQPGFWNNVGVCCGSAGVSSYSLDLFQITRNPKLKELSIRLAMNAAERATKHELDDGNVGLSWTHAEHRVRPDYVYAQTGLMQGAAGMGLWFIKLDAVLAGRDFDLGMPVHPLR